MNVVVIGGGVIGLSCAYELSSRGHSVSVLEQDKFGRKASWAGAGILIPANAETAIHSMEHLEAISHSLHQKWSRQLEEQTGIDNGYRKCGGLYLARTVGESASVTGLTSEWKARDIKFHELDQKDIAERFSPFAKTLTDTHSVSKAIWVPGEAQISNPLHIDALVAGCEKLGVKMHQETGTVRVNAAHTQIESVETHSEKFVADKYIVACGPWSENLVSDLKTPLPMQPVRGQVAMYKLDPIESVTIASGPIVNEGSRYLVPRLDGHVLVGATIEEVGFDSSTTDSGIASLKGWAESLTTHLNDKNFVKAWAGLRPGTYDGFPYIGRLGNDSNAYVATGHFKSGLHLSTATASVMSDLIEESGPPIDLQPFNPLRASDHPKANSQISDNAHQSSESR